jgi:plastocyanin
MTLRTASIGTFLALAAGVTACQSACAQDIDVQAQIQIVPPANQKTPVRAAAPAVVVWLSPVAAPDAPPVDPPPPGHFRMAQKNKTFQPHLLVVPLGSTVAFPNLDPFFHNVFSQFNGKRFDLGLYEAGSTKDVRFDHEGISWIFCNIHPEMSAVIITLATPWYSVAQGSREVTLAHVPPSVYMLHVWAEGADTKQLEALTRRVRISASQNDVGIIRIETTATAPAHKNKFGKDYRPDVPSTY